MNKIAAHTTKPEALAKEVRSDLEAAGIAASVTVTSDVTFEVALATEVRLLVEAALTRSL